MKDMKEQQKVQVGLTRRMIAYLLDWYIGGLATALPVSAISMKLYGTVQNQQIVEFAHPWSMAAGVLALLCAVLYYWAVPTFVWKGQTLGKRWLGLCICSTNGEAISPGRMALRQILGLMAIEGAIVTASTIWHQMLTIATGINFIKPLMYVGMVVSLVSSVMVLLKGHRAIHDYLGGSMVVRMKPSEQN